jgi:hypothetical protein
MTQNKTGKFSLSVYQSDGVTPQTLVGSTLWFHAAYLPAAFTINKSSPSLGITIVTPAGGLNCATLQIEPGDTAALNLIDGAVASMPCELNLVNGSESYPLNSGFLIVNANVGTP